MAIRGWVLAGATALLAGHASAGTASEARKQAESSMLVTGSIVIGEDGVVLAHEIDPKIQLTPKLAGLVRDAVAHWKFEPVKIGGQAVRAKAPMSLRLVAKKIDGSDAYNIRIASTHFGSTEADTKPGEDVTVENRVPPGYPATAASMHGRGVVYMLVRVGRDGRVIDAAAEQVNLRVVGTSRQMDMLRRDFAQSCTNALRKWTFKTPVSGPQARREEWVGRITVDFRLPQAEGDAAPGKWETYVPGPRNTAIPWAGDKLRTAGGPDAMPDSGFQMLDGGPKLLNAEAG